MSTHTSSSLPDAEDGIEVLATPEEDADGAITISSGSPPAKRRRASPAGSQSEDNQCNICLEPWTSSGPHQICSTPCGHLFGFSCIKSWLESKPARGRVCPTCKHPAKIRELRYIFGVPGKLQAADVNECVKLKHDLEKEKQAHADTREKMKQVKRVAREYLTVIRRMQRDTGVASFEGGRKQSACVDICARKVSRGAGVCADASGSFVYGEAICMSRRYKLVRYTLGTGCVSTSRQGVESKPNCMCVNEYEDRHDVRYVAVGCVTKKLYLYSPALYPAFELCTNGIPLCCTFMRTKEYVIAVGLVGGEVCLYDVRNSSGVALHSLQIEKQGWRGVHSIQSCRVGDEEVLLVATPSRVHAVCFDGYMQAPVTRPVSVTPPDTISISDRALSGIATLDASVALSWRTAQGGVTQMHASLNKTETGYELAGGDGIVKGYTQDLPYMRATLLRSGQGKRVMACVDSSARQRMGVWTESADEWKRVEWAGAGGVVREICGLSLPAGVEGMGGVGMAFGGVGDDTFRTFGVR